MVEMGNIEGENGDKPDGRKEPFELATTAALPRLAEIRFSDLRDEKRRSKKNPKPC